MLSTTTRARAPNCDEKLYLPKGDRCPECDQFHLVAGYCQALDPQSTWHESRLGLAWKAKRGEAIVPLNPISVPDVPDNVPDNPDVPDNLEIVPVKQCVACGLDFEAKRSDAQYCSDACRKRAQRG